MKYFLILLIVSLLLLLNACTKTQFGVPDEQWQLLNDEQKALAIEGYNQRQLVIEQKRLKQAHAEAKRWALQEQKRLDKIERIKRGDGDIGDIIRVSIISCKVKLGFKYRSITPLVVKLLNGEQKILEVTDKSHNSYKKMLSLSYIDNLLSIGEKYNGKSDVYLPYEQSWMRGHHYNNLSSDKGAVHFKNCNIVVSIIPNTHFRKYY